MFEIRSETTEPLLIKYFNSVICSNLKDRTAVIISFFSFNFNLLNFNILFKSKAARSSPGQLAVDKFRYHKHRYYITYSVYCVIILLFISGSFEYYVSLLSTEVIKVFK